MMIGKERLYAGAFAGVLLWGLFTLANLAVFLFAGLTGVEYAGAVVDYRGLLLYLAGGVVFGGVYDVLPGNGSTSKAIVFVLVLSLVPLSSFGFVWKAAKLPFILVPVAAGSIVSGALLGWFFDIAMKKVER